jgi:hypothetical protein
VGIIGATVKRNAAQKAMLKKFLADNGWKQTEGVGFEAVATSLLNVGDSQKVIESFEGTYKQIPFQAVTYRFSTGSGKNRREYKYTNLCFSLQNVFPLIVLDDKKNNFFGLSNLPDRISDAKKLEVEGDFYKRFNLYVLPGSEQQVLHLLSPDFMAELMDVADSADVELQADRLFIISEQDSLVDENGMKALFAMAEVVLKNIAEIADTWQKSSSAEAIAAMKSQAWQPRAEALAGKKYGWLQLVTIFVGIVGFIAMIFTNNMQIWYGTIAFIIILSIATPLLRRYKNSSRY